MTTQDIEKNALAETCPTGGVHAHDWMVFSTALADRCLLLQCARCRLLGTVDDPTKEEWAAAWSAPENPYRWSDDHRVKELNGPADIVCQKPSAAVQSEQIATTAEKGDDHLMTESFVILPPSATDKEMNPPAPKPEQKWA